MIKILVVLFIIGIAVGISFTSLLMAWVASWVLLVRGFMGGVSQALAEVVCIAWVHKVWTWVKRMTWLNFCYDSMKFIVSSCDSSLFPVFSARTVFELSTQFMFHYFTEKVLFPKIKRLKVQ